MSMRVPVPPQAAPAQNLRRWTTPARLASVLLLATLAQLQMSVADPLDVWTWRNPTPTGENFQAVTYGTGLFVAVGDVGTVFTSTNGSDWVRGTLPGWAVSPFLKTLFSITYGGGRFVAGGDGTLFYSDDGETWQQGIAPANGFSSVYGVAFRNGRFVGVTPDGPRYSDDGRTWALSAWNTSILGSPEGLTAILAGPDRFMAVGWWGWLYRSSDGINWAKVKSVGTGCDLYGIAYGNGHWVAVGDPGNTIFNSTNGVDWIAVPSPATNMLMQVTFADGQFTAVGGEYYVGEEVGTVLTSADGLDWEQQPIQAPYMLAGATSGGGTRVAVGYHGVLFSSTNGATWQERGTSATYYDLSDVVWAKGAFYAVGQPQPQSGGVPSLMTSPDGHDWQTVWSGAEQGVLRSICEGNGMLLAVGNSGAPSLGRLVVTSADGTSWTRRDVGGDEGFSMVAFGNGTFVADGDSSTFPYSYYSTNGVSWTKAQNGPRGGNPHFAGGKFLANTDTGPSSGLAVSGDGVTWQSTDLPGGVYGVAWLNSRYVATVFGVGGGGSAVYSSSNCLNWERHSIQVTPASDATGAVDRQDELRRVRVVDNQLVAEGEFYELPNYNGYSVGALYTSADGTNWVRRFNGATSRNNPTDPFAALAFGAGTILVVGERGLVLQSDVIPPPPATITSLSISNEVTLTVSGAVGRSCRLETTDALETSPVWTPLKTVLLEQSLTTFTDETGGGSVKRFYRAVTLP